MVPEIIHTPPPPPHGRSLEIPRGRGGSKAIFSKGYGGFMGNYFPKGDGPRTKHWKQRTIDLKHKNIPTYVVLKQKLVLLAAEMRLTSLALMFLFFFELASTTISRRTAMMCLWKEVETIWSGGHNWSLVFVSFSSDQHQSAFTSVHWVSLFATFTYRKHIFDRFHVLSLSIGGCNS